MPQLPPVRAAALDNGIWELSLQLRQALDNFTFSAQVASATIFTPRFNCSVAENRCSYPGGVEEGL